jgi:hypothetical protein
VKVLHTPGHTSLLKWFSTVDQLIELVKAYLNAENVMINYGHATALRPALEVLRTCRRFMENVVCGKEAVTCVWDHGGYGNGRLSLICPEKPVLDAKES